MSDLQDRRKTDWETHFSTIVNAIIVAGVLFIGGQLWGYNSKITEFTVKMEYMTLSMQELKTRFNDISDNYVKKVEFNGLEKRVRTLEQKPKSD